MMYMRYSFAKGYSPEKVPECDAGARAMGKMMVIAAKYMAKDTGHWWLVPIMWVISKNWKRKLTPEYVEYSWPWVPSNVADSVNDVVGAASENSEKFCGCGAELVSEHEQRTQVCRDCI